jgi:hypothetical protein
VTEKIKARAWRNKRKKQEMTKRQRSNPGDKPKWKDKARTRLSRCSHRYRAETEQKHNAYNPPPGLWPPIDWSSCRDQREKNLEHYQNPHRELIGNWSRKNTTYFM